MFGDPSRRIRETRYVDAESLADHVAKLKPSLGDRHTLIEHLRGLDETGALRPAWRLILPEVYIDWGRARIADKPEPSLNEVEREVLEPWLESGTRYPSGRDWERLLFAGDQAATAFPGVESGDSRSAVNWNSWLRRDPDSVTRWPRAYAFYHPYDWYLLWALVADQTAEVLLTPHASADDLRARIWPALCSANPPPPDKAIARTFRGGSPSRTTKLARDLASGEWLRDLYRFQIIDHATIPPNSIGGDYDGSRLVAHTTDLVDLRTNSVANLNAAWRDREPEFRARLSDLAEFALALEESGFREAFRAARSDAIFGLHWMVECFGTRHVDALRSIPAGRFTGKTLGHVLQPTWMAALSETRFLATVFGSAVGKWSKELELTAEDFGGFFDWLEANDATAYAIALSGANAEMQKPSDAHAEKLAIYMLALAAQVESILDLVSAKLHPEKDCNRDIREKLGMTLAQHPGARGRIWQQITSNWKTLVRLPATDARQGDWWADRLQMNADMEARGEIDGAAAAVLTYGFVRHALAHAFVPWDTVARGWNGRTLYACAYTPCLYWKLGGIGLSVVGRMAAS